MYTKKEIALHEAPSALPFAGLRHIKQTSAANIDFFCKKRTIPPDTRAQISAGSRYGEDS